MATIGIELRKIINRDGTSPLALRIITDSKPRYKHLGQNLLPNHWDAVKQRVKKSHPNSARLNNFLSKKVTEYTDKLLEVKSDQQGVSAGAVKTILAPPKGSTTFFTVAQTYLDNFKLAGKYNRYKPDSSRMKRFREFLKDRDVSFQEITVASLNQFRAWLKGKHNASERSVVNHLIIIRTVFNIAIESYGLDRKHYPFGKGKIQIRIPDSLKIGFDIDEVKKIEDLNLENHFYLNHCKNLWLFSFYFAGMRISDVLRLKWADFQNGRLYYSMGKNEKPGSLKIPEKAEAILEQYINRKEKGCVLVFPELDRVKDLEDRFEAERQIAFAVKKIDEALSKIAENAKVEKKLTMHISRHSFGNISGEKIPLKMLQKLYRHSSITTTIGYQANFIFKEADEALDAVIGF